MINVWPFRSSRDKDAPLVLPPDDFGFVSEFFGGIVRGNVTIHEREEPYIVRRHIYVECVSTGTCSF